MAFYRNSSCRKHNGGQRNNERRPTGEDAQNLLMSTGAGLLPWLVRLLDTQSQKEARICPMAQERARTLASPQEHIPQGNVSGLQTGSQV